MKIKNVSGQTQTYAGKVLENNEEYLIQEIEINKFANDDLLLEHCAAMKTLVYNEDNIQAQTGSQAIDFLKRKTPSFIIQKAEKNYDKLRPRAIIFEAEKNSITMHYFKFDKTLSIRGGILYSNGTLGDSIRITVCDKDNILGYGENVDLDEFAKKIAVIPNEKLEIIDLNASEPILENLYLKIEYSNTSVETNAKVVINFLTYDR